jgi:hypothetical protein
VPWPSGESAGGLFPFRLTAEPSAHSPFDPRPQGRRVRESGHDLLSCRLRGCRSPLVEFVPSIFAFGLPTVGRAENPFPINS